MEPLLKFFLPIYLVVYLLAAFLWRTFVVWKRTGVNPLVFKGSDSAHDYIGRVFKFLIIPSAATLLTFVLGVVLIQIQVRLEEEFLARSHGEEYAEYMGKVRRWL